MVETMEHLDCSCVDCTYGGSPKKSLKKLIALGDRFDELYLGKFLPLRERKLLEKLIRTRAVYYEIRADLLASGTDFSVDSNKNQKLSEKKTSKNVENLNKKKGRVIQRNNCIHSNCCSCCSVLCDPKSIDLVNPPKVQIHYPPPEVIDKLVEKYPPKKRKKPRRVDKKKAERIRSLRIEQQKGKQVIRSSSAFSREQKLKKQELQGKTHMEKVIVKTSSQSTTMSKRHLKKQEIKRKRQVEEFMRSKSQGTMIHKHKLGEMSEQYVKVQEMKRKKHVGRSISQGTMIHKNKLGEMSERRRKEQEMERKKQVSRSISQDTIHKHKLGEMSAHRQKQQQMERKEQAGEFTRSTSKGIMVSKHGLGAKDGKIKDFTGTAKPRLSVGHKYKMKRQTSQTVGESKSFATKSLAKAAYSKDKNKSQKVTESQILKQKEKKSTESVAGSRQRKKQIKEEKEKRFRDVKDSVLKIKEKVDEGDDDVWPCELGVCVPDECDPQTCLKRIHEKIKVKGEHLKRTLDGIDLKQNIVSLKEKFEVNKKSDGDIKFACELGICVPDKCEPERCLQRIKEGLGKGDHIMHSLSSKISTSSKSLKVKILNKKNIDKFACEPGICVPNECKPEECLKEMKRRKEGLVKKTLTKITIISRRTQKRDSKKRADILKSKPKKSKGVAVGIKKSEKALQKNKTMVSAANKSEKKDLKKDEKSFSLAKGDLKSKSDKIRPANIETSKSSKMMKIDSSKSVPNIKQINDKTGKLSQYECEPGICVPDECDPMECLKYIKLRNKDAYTIKHTKSTEVLAKSASGIQTRKYQADRHMQHKTKVHKHAYECDPRICKPGKQHKKHKVSKKLVTPETRSSGSETTTIYAEIAVQKRSKKKKRRLYECKPGICDSETCDPLTCIKKAKKRLKKKATESSKTSSSRIQTTHIDENKRTQHKASKVVSQIAKKFVTPETRSSGSETTTIHADIAVQKRSKKTKRRLYECKPGICDSETCDPLTCIKKAKKRLKKKATEPSKMSLSRIQTKHIDGNKKTQHKASKVVSQIAKPTKVYHKKPKTSKFTSSSSQTLKKSKKSIKYPGHTKSIHTQISIKLPKNLSKPKAVNDVKPKLKTIKKTEEKYMHVKEENNVHVEEEKARFKNITERHEHSKSLRPNKMSAITIMPERLKSITTGCHRQAVRLGSSCSFSIEIYKERCGSKSHRQSSIPPLSLKEHYYNPNEYDKPVEVLHRRKHKHKHHKHTESQDTMTILRPETKTEASTTNAGFKTKKNQIKLKQSLSDTKEQTDKMNTIKQQTGKMNVPGVKLQTDKMNVPGVKLQTENVIEKVPGVKIQTEKVTGTKQQTEGIIEKVPGTKQQTDTSSFENVMRSVGVTVKRKHHKKKDFSHSKKVQSNIKLSTVIKSSSTMRNKKNQKQQLITTTESSAQANIAKVKNMEVDTDRQDKYHENTKLPDITYACEKDTCDENECDPRECYEKIKMKHLKKNKNVKSITASNKRVKPKQIFTTVSRPPSETRHAVRIGSKCSFDIEFYKDRLQSGDTGHTIKRYYSNSDRIVTKNPRHKHRKSKNTLNNSTAGHMLRRCFCTLHMHKKHKHQHSHRVIVNLLTIPNSFVYSIRNNRSPVSHQLSLASTKSNKILSLDCSPLENAISCKTITNIVTSNKSKVILNNLPINNATSETRLQQSSIHLYNMMSPENFCPTICSPESDGIVREILNIPIDNCSKVQSNCTNKRFQRFKKYFRKHLFNTNTKNNTNSVTECYEIKTRNPTASPLQTHVLPHHIKNALTTSLLTSKSDFNNGTIHELPTKNKNCNICDVNIRSYMRCHSSSKKPSLRSKLKKYLNIFNWNALTKNHKISKDKKKIVKCKNSSGLISESDNVHSIETHPHMKQVSDDIKLNRQENVEVVVDIKWDSNNLEEINKSDFKYVSPSNNIYEFKDIYDNYDVKRNESILSHRNYLVTKAKSEENKIPAQILKNKTTSSSTPNLYNDTHYSQIRLSAFENETSDNCDITNIKAVPSSKNQTTESQTEDNRKNNLNSKKIFQFLVEAFEGQDSLLQSKNVKSNINKITNSFAQFPSKYDFNQDELYRNNSFIWRIDKEQHPNKSEIFFSEFVSKSLTGISKYLRRSYFTLNLEEKRTRSHKHAKKECEPGVCDAGECYPNDCLKRVNRHDAKHHDRGTEGNKDSIARSLIKQRGRKRRHHEHERDMPDEYIVEEPRTLKNIVQTFAPRRQAVKLGSTFSFNIEFYKERKDGICFSQPSQVVRKPVQRKPPPPPVKYKKQVQPIKQCSASTCTANVRDYRDVGTVGEPPMRQHREAQIGHTYKETAIGPREKCHCTAKLQTKPKRKETISTTTMAVREQKTTGAGEIKYACDKGLCTSGLCDPKKCMQKKLGTKPVTASIASVTYRPQRDTSAGVRVQKKSERGVKVKPPKRRHQETRVISTEPEPTYKSVGIQKKPKPVKRYVQRYGQPLQIEAPESSDECSRQAVKIGSSFDFNVEFFKDKCDSSDKHVRFAEPGYDDDERQQAEVTKPTRHKIKSTMTNPLKRCFCTLKLQKQGNDDRDQKRKGTPSTAAYYCKCKYGLSYTHVADPYKNTRQIKKKRYFAATTHHSEVNFSPDSSSLSSHKCGLGDVSPGYIAHINCDPLSCFDFSETSSSHSIFTILPYRAKKHKNSSSALTKPKTKKLVRNQSTSVVEQLDNSNPKTVTINVSYPSTNRQERYNRPYMTIAYDTTNIKIYPKFMRSSNLKRHKITNKIKA